MYCKKCGNLVEDSFKFCKVCGTPVERRAQQPTEQAAQQGQTTQNVQPTYNVAQQVSQAAQQVSGLAGTLQQGGAGGVMQAAQQVSGMTGALQQGMSGMAGAVQQLSNLPKLAAEAAGEFAFGGLSAIGSTVGGNKAAGIIGKIISIICSILAIVLAIRSKYAVAIVISILTTIFTVVRMLTENKGRKGVRNMAVFLLVFVMAGTALVPPHIVVADGEDTENEGTVDTSELEEFNPHPVSNFYADYTEYGDDFDEDIMCYEDFETFRQRYEPLQKLKGSLNDKGNYKYRLTCINQWGEGNSYIFRYIIEVWEKDFWENAGYEKGDGQSYLYLMDIRLDNLSVPLHNLSESGEYYGENSVEFNYYMTDIDDPDYEIRLTLEEELHGAENGTSTSTPAETVTIFGQRGYQWQAGIFTSAGDFERDGACYIAEVPLDEFDETIFFKCAASWHANNDDIAWAAAQPEIDSFKNATLTVTEPVLFRVRVNNEDITVIDTEAPDTPGEDDGVIVYDDNDDDSSDDRTSDTDKDKDDDDERKPGQAVPPILIGVGGAAVEEATRKKKRKSYFKLHIFKDFGNVIRRGDNPCYVYARIVEYTSDGMQIDRPDLSATVQIYSSDGVLYVREGGMSGNYKAAEVSAQEGGTGDYGTVSFRFTYKGKTTIENMNFKLEEPKIVFAQENLGLPVKTDKEYALPLYVSGYDASMEMTAEISPAGYEVKLRPASNVAGHFEAVIKETKKDEQEPGSVEIYSLSVRAVSHGAYGDNVISAELPVYRICEGLAVDTEAIGCYLAVREGMEQIPESDLKKSDYEPAVTKAQITLIVCDTEKNEILRIAPYPITTTFTPDKDASEDDKNKLSKIGLKLTPVDQMSDYTFAKIRAEEGVLDPPSRFFVNMKVSTEWDGKKYENEKRLLLRSQPVRDMYAPMAYDKQDKEDRDCLEHIRGRIVANHADRDLLPVIRLIDLMLSGYDEKYGYDRKQMETVKRTWNAWLKSEQGMHVYEQQRNSEDYSLGDYVWEKFLNGMDNTEYLEENMGFFSRLGLGVMTIGGSEITFTAFKVAREMKAYSDSGHDSVFDGMVAGIKVVAIEYPQALAAGTAIKYGIKYIPASVKEGAAKYAGKLFEKVSAFTGRKASNIGKSAVQATKDETNAALKEADDLIRAVRRSGKESVEQAVRDEGFLRASKEGFAKVKRLEASWQKLKAAKTPENIKAYREAFEQVWTDGAAKTQLENYNGPLATDVREGFLQLRREIYEAADRGTVKRLSKSTGIPENRIVNKNVTGVKKGAKAARDIGGTDRDNTWMDVGKDGLHADEISEAVQKEAYALEFHKAMYGEEVDVATALKTLERFDQAVVAGANHPEKYADLSGMLFNHSEKLLNAQSDVKTVIYKTMEWVSKGRAAEKTAYANWQAADSALKAAQASGSAEAIGAAEAALDKALLEVGNAEFFIREGMRQHQKIWKSIIDPRNLASMTKGNASAVSKELRVSEAVLSRLYEAQGATNLSPAEVERVLAELGTDLEKLIADGAQVLIDSNA